MNPQPSVITIYTRNGIYYADAMELGYEISVDGIIKYWVEGDKVYREYLPPQWSRSTERVFSGGEFEEVFSNQEKFKNFCEAHGFEWASNLKEARKLWKNRMTS